MTQSERRMYLLRELLKEQPWYQEIQIPTNKEEQIHLLRSLFNVRMPGPVSNAFLEIQDAYLQEETARKGITDIADLAPIQDSLYLWQGDMKIFHQICEDNGIVHDNSKIFEYLCSFEEKNSPIQLNLFD